MLNQLQKEENDKNFYVKLILIIITISVFTWLILPPKNKTKQVLYSAHSLYSNILKLTGNTVNKEYLIHRNNAVYIVNLYPKNSEKIDIALREIDLAFRIFPSNGSENERKQLYKDRAYIKYYAGKYASAIDDFLLADSAEYNDILHLAVLYNKTNQYDKAYDLCTKLVNIDEHLYQGYACLASIRHIKKDSISPIDTMTLAIDNKAYNPYAYLERAMYKKLNNDIAGANEDIEKAKEQSPTINTHDTLENIMHYNDGMNLPLKNL